MNDDEEDRRTPLEKVMNAYRLQPTEIKRAIDRIAAERGLPSISRHHLFRLRKGLSQATADKILILVAAMRQMTGTMLQPADLFLLDPGLAGAPAAPVFSSGSRRTTVSADHPAPTSEEGFERLYVEYGVLLRTIAMRGFGVPPDDAEALVHDCFIAYLQRRTAIHDVKGWLSGTMRNTCRHYLRDRKREAPLGPEHEATIDPAAQAAMESWMRKLTLAAVLSRLGAKCRETLRGYYLAEEPKEALAGRLSTSTGYIDQLLSTCRRRAHQLFRMLSKSNDDRGR